MSKIFSEAQRTAQGKDFELIPTVKMNTRSTSRWVEGQFGSEFPAICNHCVVMTFWSRKTWQFCEKFFKTTSYGKIIQNFVPKVYMATPIDGVLSKCRKICPTGNRRNRALFTGQKKTKFRLLLKLSLLCGSRPKSARAIPQQCAHSAPDFIQFGSLSAEL